MDKISYFHSINFEITTYSICCIIRIKKSWWRDEKRRSLKIFLCTVFPHIVSAETILFWLWPYVLWPLISVHKCAETIQGGKLFKGGNYMRKYGFPHSELTCSHLESCSSGSIWALEGTELMRKCWISLKIILGTMYSATHINSAGGSAGPWLALGPWCWEQKPDSPKAEKF